MRSEQRAVLDEYIGLFCFLYCFEYVLVYIAPARCLADFDIIMA